MEGGVFRMAEVATVTGEAEVAPKKHWKPKVTLATKQKMLKLRKTGLSYQKIAEKFGVSTMTVFSHLNPKKRLGFRVRKTQYERMQTRFRQDPEIRRCLTEFMTKYREKIDERNRKIKFPIKTSLKCPYCQKTWQSNKGYAPSACPICGRLLIKLPTIHVKLPTIAAYSI